MQSRAHEAPRGEATVLVGIDGALRGEREVAKRIRGRGRRRPRDLPVLAVQAPAGAAGDGGAEGAGDGGPPRAGDGQGAIWRSAKWTCDAGTMGCRLSFGANGSWTCTEVISLSFSGGGPIAARSCSGTTADSSCTTSASSAVDSACRSFPPRRRQWRSTPPSSRCLLDGIDIVAVKRPRKWEPPKISAATAA